MTRDRRSFLRASGVALATGLAGCAGGDGGDAPSPTGSPTPSPTPGSNASPTPSPTPGSTASPTATAGAQDAQAAYPDYSWSQLDGVEPAPTATIEMAGFAFQPLVAAVGPGTEVTVTNADSARHTLTVPKLRIDETLDGGSSTSFVIDRTGRFDYVCAFHPPDMLGRLVVTEDTPTPGDAGTATSTQTEGGGLY